MIKKNTLLITGLSLCASGLTQAQSPPNMVMVIADDWGFPHAGAYGDKVVKTPAFDYVASRGVLFTNAFCAAPTSSASRAAILTGCYPHSLNELANLYSRFPADLQTYVDLLEANGYVVGLESKGWGPGDFTFYGRNRNPAGWLHSDLALFMDSVPASKPICFWVGSTLPHRPYKEGIGAANGIDPASVTVSPNLPDTETVRSDMADYYYYTQQFDARCREILNALERNGRLDNTLFVITSDNGYAFPRAKANLYDEGVRIPLAMMWPATFKKPSTYDGFVNLIDLAPTFLAAAGIKPDNPMHGRSLIPVLQGVEKQGKRPSVFIERERHANARAGNVSYPSRALRTADFLYIRNYRPNRWPAGDPDYNSSQGFYSDCDRGPSKQFMLDNRAAYPQMFDLAFGFRPAEELYDLSKDPYQKTNVATDPAYARQRSKMSKEMDQWMRSTGDPRVDSTTDIFDTYPYAGN